jgi:hypothetical protein
MHRTCYSWRLYSTIFILINLFFCGFIRYEIPCENKLIKLSYDIALSQVGISESKNNDGEVEKYLFSVGLGKGYPYCMAGQYWAFDSASRKLNKINPLLKTGSSSAQFNYLKNKGIKNKFNLNKYDLVFWRENNSWKGHVERIIEVGKVGYIRTIGFNVKHKNQEGVFIKTRNIFHIIGRLKFIGAIGFHEKNN